MNLQRPFTFSEMSEVLHLDSLVGSCYEVSKRSPNAAVYLSLDNFERVGVLKYQFPWLCARPEWVIIFERRPGTGIYFDSFVLSTNLVRHKTSLSTISIAPKIRKVFLSLHDSVRQHICMKMNIWFTVGQCRP